MQDRTVSRDTPCREMHEKGIAEAKERFQAEQEKVHSHSGAGPEQTPLCWQAAERQRKAKEQSKQMLEETMQLQEKLKQRQKLREAEERQRQIRQAASSRV